MKEYFNKCIDYYISCVPVKWKQIEKLYEEYADIDKED